MGINVINPIAPQQFLWLVKVVKDTKTGGKIIIMNAKIQRSITATVTIDKVLKTSGNLGKQLVKTASLVRRIVK